MSTGLKPNWQEALENLWHRNGAIEVTSTSSDEGVSPTYRTRLLEIRGDALIVERPPQPESGRFLKRGAEINILAIEGDKRWEMHATVTGLTAFQLNASTRVPAIELTMPLDGHSAQRRHYFRVTTAGGGLNPVVMMPLMEEPPEDAPRIAAEEGTPDAAETEAEAETETETEADIPLAFFAKLVNIGGGGIGVEAPQRVSSQLTGVARYICRLDLPTFDEPMELSARVVHLAPLDGGTHYLGLCFEFDSRLHRLKSEDLICKFTAWYQRQQIQRVKGT